MKDFLSTSSAENPLREQAGYGSGKPLRESAFAPVHGDALGQEACADGGVVSDNGQYDAHRIAFETRALSKFPFPHDRRAKAPQRAAILINPSSICQSERLRSIRDLDSSCNLPAKVSLNWSRILQAEECFCRGRATDRPINCRQAVLRDQSPFQEFPHLLWEGIGGANATAVIVR